MARIEIDLDMEDLPYELADQCTDAALIRFIMEIDEQVHERSFTETLLKLLTQALEEEDEA